ncbi:zinc knuckle CX2CX4HX4C containing protein [Tanacetum coccineum]|uniref:Zinc knuckle CX2CX4HX4C containing protein n=1 Tax=Tanacetum coccineum TaxID=301880 RepID=A0ABQ5ATW3_9ASTR
MQELRKDTFFRNKNDDAHEHVERVLDIVSLFNFPGVSHDAVMLRVFPITLTGAVKRWVDRLPSGAVDSWDLSLRKPLSKGTAHHQKLPSSLKKSATSSKKETKHSTKLGNSIMSFYIDSPPMTSITIRRKLREYNKLSMENSVDLSQTTGFSDNEEQETDDSGMAEAVAALEATLKKKREEPKKVKQNVNYYVDPYEPPIPFPKRLEHHAEEALVHQTMESLKKIKINRPLLKEIRQTDNYAKQMKYLVENKLRTQEDNEIRMNPRCSALLQNHLPPKEHDPGSFILPCSIRKLDFKNALADLGTSISIMPFSMYKRLGIGKLEQINMLIEMANNTKCAPKGIVENLLIKIDKFIFPVDFVILDMVEDIRMPIILERPLLATAHAQVDIFRKTISLEVGSEKVIFKMRSSFTTTNIESVCAIKSEAFIEDDNLKEIDYDLFLYDSESCEFNRAILQEKENECQYWASGNPNSDICDGGDLPINIEKHYWESNNDSKREELEWENLSLNDLMRIRYGKVCKTTGERILKDYWRERFEGEEDDLEEYLEDPEEFREDKADTMLGVIHDKLNNDWFNNFEGILDYLKPRSYDGFIDLDDEAYNKRRCRLLGMTYEEPTPILIKKAKVTRYTVGLGETYTKVKVLGVEKIPRTRDNVAAMRAKLMKKWPKKEITKQRRRTP